MNKKRLFVDCQVFQYNTWYRGMGRYTLKLVEALNKEKIELNLIFNKNLGLENDRLQAIKKACPNANIIHLRLSEDPNKAGGWKKLQEICAEELDDQLADRIKPEDTYLIASNFALRYCSTFPNLDCKKAIIFYDLTPYLHWGDYGRSPDFEPNKYFAQFKTLFRADQLWAISQSAADEATDWLGIDTRKVENIRGASIRNLDEKSRKPDSISKELFLLCPSADGPNKNNENMVRAFAEFNKKTGNKFKLVITSDFSNQSKATLGAISQDLIFSGHVSDGELSWLYEHCEGLLFVSKTEGLGLPILEAAVAGKKVVCSDIKVFKEISEDAFYFANPNNIQAISDALSEALIMQKNWSLKKKQYPEISNKFSWHAAAKTCMQLIEKPVAPEESDSKSVNRTIYYSDYDGFSLSRDVAEILYPLNQSATFKSLRNLNYSHNSPSYLVEMGVAQNALEFNQKKPETRNIYIIDDSEQSLQLLYYAIQNPGLIIAVFQQAKTPIIIEEYLNKTFDGKLTYKSFMKQLNLAGNHIIHKAEFSTRGSAQFNNEVNLFNKQVISKES